jgi:hypothetical protein
MRSEHEPLGGADLTCPRCKYMTVRWLSDLQIYSCFRLGCGWEGVDPTNPAPLATQMRQQHERVATCHYEPVASTAEAFVAEMRKLANDGGLDCGHCRLQPTCQSEWFVGCQQVQMMADAFGVPQQTDGPRDYLAARETEGD